MRLQLKFEEAFYKRVENFSRAKTYIGGCYITKNKFQLSDLTVQEVPQDLYLRDYDPSLHNIKYNNSIPKIAVRVGDTDIVIDELELTVSFAKEYSCGHMFFISPLILFLLISVI